jgi:ferredoxin
MGKTWRVEVNRDRCMGTGACVFAAPGVFVLDSDGLATVVGEVEDGDRVVIDAVAECPTEALSLVPTEEGGGPG